MTIDPDIQKVLKLDQVSHIGIVVRDMKRARKNYSGIFGIEFPQVFTPEYFKKTYWGKPANFRVMASFAKMGEVQLELIEVLEGECPHKEFLERNGEGIHHLAFVVNNLDERIEAFEKLGIGIMISVEREGVRAVYMDTEKAIGVIVELIERKESNG